VSERLLSQDSTAEIRGTEMCGAGNSRLRRPEAPAHFGKGNVTISPHPIQSEMNRALYANITQSDPSKFNRRQLYS